jgi:uncharacterized membrane protein YhaH (DUF805 family)
MSHAGDARGAVMSLKDSVVYCLTNYFKFSGRGSRPEFWWFMLACTIAGLIAAGIDTLDGREILDPIVSLGTIIPTVAAAARRLHDTDRSGKWQLIGIIPLIGWIVLIVWLASRGTAGSNRFGQGPEPAAA